MTDFLLSAGERQRLEAVKYFDPGLGASFDQDPHLQDLVQAVAAITGTPISIVTLIGEDKQWFMAQMGLEGVHQTSREVAFCAHTIQEGRVLEINDAKADPRFASNPLVTDSPGIRFYAGAPLVTRDGQHVGALCAIDTKPGLLTDSQREALVHLARVAVHILETKRETRKHALVAAQLTALNEHSPMGIYAADAAGAYVQVNAKCMEIYGQTTQESLGSGWLERIDPEDRTRVWQAWTDSMAKGSVFDQEFRVTRPDGAENLVRSVARPVITEDGKVAGLVGSLEEVTLLRQQSRLLEAKRERLNLIVQASGIATFEWNEQTKELKPSPELAGLSGHDLKDYVNTTSDNLCDWVHPDDRDLVGMARMQVRNSPSGELEVVFRKLHKDGRIIWILMRARVVTRTLNGAPEWILATQMDVTERKKSTEQVARSEQLLRQMGEVAGVGGWDLDLETNQLTWTTETRRIHGVASDFQPDVATAISFYEPCSRPVILAAVETAIATGKPWDLELQLLRTDGTLIWVRAVGAVIRIDNKTTRIYGAFQDISERVARQLDLVAQHQRVVLATDSSGIGVWELDLTTGALNWDKQMYRIYGMENEALNHDASEIWAKKLHPEDRLRINAEINSAIAEGRRFESEFRIQMQDGHTRYVRSMADMVVDPRSGRSALLGVNWDVTQMRNISAALAEQHEWMRVTLRSIGDAVITTDDHGVVTWLNPIAEFMTGWSLDEAIGRPMGQIFQILNEVTLQPAQNPVETCLTEARAVGLTSGTILVSRTGQQYGIEDSAAPIRDDKNTTLGAVMVFHDVTNERRIKEEMAYRATHDVLTGMKNRSEFEICLAQLLQRARAGDGAHTLLFIDLDHFKRINDSCGHAAGDEVLQQVAEILGNAIRTRDVVARIGGDEFAILLEYCLPDDAMRIAQKICDQMEIYRYTHKDRRFRIGASVGAAAIDATWPSAEAIVQAADAACLDAKDSGRNRVRLWQGAGEYPGTRLAEVGWAARIEDALENRQFRLFVQEIAPVDLHQTGRHGEVLIRLQEDSGALTLPGQFLPSAERFNLIGAIDRWVLRETLQMLHACQQLDDIHALSVNIAGRSVSDRAFHRFAIEILTNAGPTICEKLVIEITETSAVSNLVNATAFIEQLHALGVRVSLDDFGAGSASFGHLRSLNVDILKIDGQFVQGLNKDPLSLATVRCFIDVANVLGIPTVAEFVDRPELQEQLSLMGVSFLQGFHIALPVPIEEFLRGPPTGYIGWKGNISARANTRR